MQETQKKAYFEPFEKLSGIKVNDFAGSDFTKMLGQMSSDAVNSVKKAETMSVDALQGGSNLQQVVQAVMSAQENLQTALAVRDKSVAAFQEVTRMSI